MSQIVAARAMMAAEKARSKKLAKRFSLGDVSQMDFDNDGQVDKVEFLTAMLITLHDLEKSDIDKIVAVS